ncbi:unnamed protein product [Soboliphyme baturini]|uniref:Transposase n=1 Tax=Soboliphyme baturini TaxID=241478 RepID=A0A183IFG1_9BILA|nr:unnamed protein product [Soboliphyme baturini]
MGPNRLQNRKQRCAVHRRSSNVVRRLFVRRRLLLLVASTSVKRWAFGRRQAGLTTDHANPSRVTNVSVEDRRCCHVTLRTNDDDHLRWSRIEREYHRHWHREGGGVPTGCWLSSPRQCLVVIAAAIGVTGGSVSGAVTPVG